MLLSTLASGGGQQQDGHVLCSSRNRSTAQAIESYMGGDGQTSEPGYDRRGWVFPGGFWRSPPVFFLLRTVKLFCPFDPHPRPHPSPPKRRFVQRLQVVHP